jgi:hypothetical protein
MAGPLTIQRFPKGLIDLLGMRATGDTPAQLAQDVGGSLELQDLYLFDRLIGQRTGTAVAINALGNFAFLNQSVPDGRLRFLYGLSVEVPAPAAATALTLVLTVNRGAANVRNFVGPSTKLIAGEGNAWGAWFGPPMLLGPGDSTSIYCSQVTGAPAVTVTGIAWYADVGI